MSTAIRVRQVSKRYTIHHQVSGGSSTLRAALANGLNSAGRTLLRTGREKAASPSKEDFWALRDISFDVQEGDRIGVIGRNGAGKSTLLKLLCRITEPSVGEIHLHGRIAGLLEVGAGFHPELTGRENIFLNGAILGMSGNEIRAKFDQIVEFADVTRFLDTPLKRYSSGMYVRLAFSVAAHLEPEILIVDEVLAVGDLAFQRKCLRKMNDVANAGRTVVLVSHNMLQMQNFCTKAIWLHEGHIKEIGAIGDVISGYFQTFVSTMIDRKWDNVSDAPGNAEVRIRRARVRPRDDRLSGALSIHDSFSFEFLVQNLSLDVQLNVNLQLYNEHGLLIFESAPVDDSTWERPLPKGTFRYTCQVPGNLLNDGIHRATLVIIKNYDQILHREEDILIFEIVDSIHKRAGWYGSWDGAVRPMLDWKTEFVARDEL